VSTVRAPGSDVLLTAGPKNDYIRSKYLCRSEWPRRLGLFAAAQIVDLDPMREGGGGHGCLHVFSDKVSAMGQSHIQRSPTDCGASLSVIYKPPE
jgi:hypothetical protein